MANICCPPGYTYNTDTLVCDSQDLLSPVSTLPPVPCACCPPGYAFILPDGSFFNPLTYTYTIIGNPDISGFIGKCVTIANLGSARPWARLPPDTVAQVGCPCCPPGYTYSSINNNCVAGKGTDPVATTICLDCNCFEVALFTNCLSCTTAGESISFSYDFTTRQCTDCCSDTPVTPPCNIVTFMPIQFADPNTTFKLLLLNYM